MKTLEELKQYIQTFGLSQGVEERVIKMTQVAYFIGKEEAFEKAAEMIKETKKAI